MLKFQLTHEKKKNPKKNQCDYQPHRRWAMATHFRKWWPMLPPFKAL